MANNICVHAIFLFGYNFCCNFYSGDKLFFSVTLTVPSPFRLRPVVLKRYIGSALKERLKDAGPLERLGTRRERRSKERRLSRSRNKNAISAVVIFNC